MAKNNKQTAGQDGVSKMVALGSKKFIAQQLNYARTSAVMHAQTGDVQSHNSCCAIAEGISSSNLSYLFQQLILYTPRTYVIFYRHLSRIFQRFHLYRCASSSVSVGLSSLILPSSVIFR